MSVLFLGLRPKNKTLNFLKSVAKKIEFALFFGAKHQKITQTQSF